MPTDEILRPVSFPTIFSFLFFFIKKGTESAVANAAQILQGAPKEIASISCFC